MTGAALGLALAAAVLHALWNVLLGGARDVLAATAVALGASVLLAAPVALLTGGLGRDAVPYLVVSGALETVYFFLLAAAYTRHEVGLIYPIARGGGPVLVLFGGLFVGESPGLVGAIGVLAVAAGIVLVRGIRGGSRAGTALGLAIAALVAAYTLVDAKGIEHAEPIAYLTVILVPVALAAGLRAGPVRLRAAASPTVVAAGVAGFAAYALVLAALRLAPAAPVAAVRETSVVFAVGLSALLLRKRPAPARYAGAALVAAGVALIGA